MFTGLIEEVGRIRTSRPRGSGLLVEIEASVVLEGLRRGDSVSVNGVCLTASSIEANFFTADMLEETRKRTCFDRIRVGASVNLERPVRASDRMGGHFVQGHVDGVAEVSAIRPAGEDRVVSVRYPADLARYFVEKGSVALDGVSLTIARIDPRQFDVALIPETFTRTTLGMKKPGDPLHIEVDVIGKYVEKFLKTPSR